MNAFGRPWPEFSLSASKVQRLTTGCMRAYYYDVFGSWRGWDRGLPDESMQREAYRYKHVRSLPAVVGNIIHTAAEGAVRVDIDVDRWTERAHDRIDEAVCNHDNWFDDPKRNTGIAEILYPEDHDLGDAIERAKDKASSAIANLAASEHIHRVRRGGAESVYAEQFSFARRAIARTPTGELRVVLGLEVPYGWEACGSVRVFAQPDLGYVYDGALYLVDWKTGSPRSSHEVQLACYAACSVHTAKHPDKPVVVESVYLTRGEVTRYTDSAASRQLAEDAFSAALQRHLDLIVDGDLDRNQPKPLEAFPMSDDEGQCRRCDYRGLCGRAA
jgi:hypothetical protein